MIKKIIILLLYLCCFLICSAQEEMIHHHIHYEKDTICSHFHDSISIDFEVSRDSGCDYLITQLLNLSNTPPEDSLSFFWNLFNEDSTISFIFTEENPDVFLSEPGIYHLCLIITNRNGCADTLTRYNVISLDKMPQINFSYTPENALFAEYFGEVEFTNLTDTEFSIDSTVLWYWDMGDHVINIKDWSPVHLFSSWGDYHTTFHLKTKNGCKVALTKTVIIEGELFFPDILKKNSDLNSSIFAITNLNTNIPKDDPNEFRNNYLFIYNENGEKVYERKNYDSYIKNDEVVKGVYVLNAADLMDGEYFYSFYYKGKSKMIHYSGMFLVGK